MMDSVCAVESRPPSLRDRQRAERELLILHEAERLLREEGYEGLVMDQLAERVGVSKGTLYQHFAKKEDLVGAIVLRDLARADELLTSQLAEHDRPAAARLGAVLAMLLERDMAGLATISGPWKHEIFTALADQPGPRGAFARFFDGLCTLIRQGQAGGEFDPALPAPIAARFLLCVVRARGGPSMPSETAVSGEDYAALAVLFCLHGLCAPPAP